MENEVIPDDPVQHTIPKPASIMTPIQETSVEDSASVDDENREGNSTCPGDLGGDGQTETMDEDGQKNPPSSHERQNGSSSSSESSDLSEFDNSDDQEDFEVWSTDNTSPDISDDESSKLEAAQSAELPEVQTEDPRTEYWRFIRQEKIQKFEFTGVPHLLDFGFKDSYTPLECFSLFVTDDLVNLMVTETNRFARDKVSAPGDQGDRVEEWVDVTAKELRKFLGLMMFMSTIRSPGLTFYWSGSSDTGNGLAGRVMKESRFLQILTNWYFGNDKDTWYPKIKNIIDMLNEMFKKYKEPGETLYVGKETIYLRDIYVFQKQILDIPDPKRGLRLLRLIDGGMYTYKISILPPENLENRLDLTKKVVLDLVEDYLNEGRRIFFHSLYISLDLAQELLKNKTHVVGRIRKNCRSTPRDLSKKKVELEEAKGFQNPDGLSVVKYKTIGKTRVRTGYALTTCHGRETVQLAKLIMGGRRMFVKNQSSVLCELSKSDKLFESVDEFSFCDSPLNNQTTWYRRIAHELLTGACVINAYCLYKKLNNHRTKFYKFHTQLWKELVGFESFHDDSYSSDDTFDEDG